MIHCRLCTISLDLKIENSLFQEDIVTSISMAFSYSLRKKVLLLCRLKNRDSFACFRTMNKHRNIINIYEDLVYGHHKKKYFPINKIQKHSGRGKLFPYTE